MSGNLREIIAKLINMTKHLFKPERLTQDINGTGLTCPIEHSGLTEAGHHDNVRRWAESANFSKAFNTTFTGQLDVHKSDVVTEILEFSDRLFTGTRDIHMAITHPESNHKALGEIGIVFDDQYIGYFMDHRKNP